MGNSLAHTPLYDWHAAHGGRLVDFAGWEMPIQYSSIVAEHQATRTAAGVFDISHMGRLSFIGAGAEAFLDRIVTRRVTDMRPGQIRYALVTGDSGGILDDVLVYRVETAPLDPPAWTVVVNASNRSKIVDWLGRHGVDQACEFRDFTVASAMIAVQGPRAADVLAPLLGDAHRSLRYYHAHSILLSGEFRMALVSRTGYTGEDGFELIVNAPDGPDVWARILEAGRSLGVLPAGLGARDTLRLEAAMPLYGHELTEQIDPYQAGLSFAVDLEGRTFPGRDALAQLRQQPERPVRVGWQLAGGRVPREGFAVLAGGQCVGHVSSGTFSPTLEQSIAMGYSRPQQAQPGTVVSIDIRGHQEPARVTALPFYRRPSSGRKS